LPAVDYDQHGHTYTRHRRADPRSLGVGSRSKAIRPPRASAFFEAFWNRREALLDPDLRASQSIWEVVGPAVEDRIVTRLWAALESGAWDAEHGHLRDRDSFDGCLRLVISEP
jgi:hypothetical protein